MSKIRAWFAENTSISPKELMNDYTIPEVEDLMLGFEKNNKKTASSSKALDGKDAINVLINKKL